MRLDPFGRGVLTADGVAVLPDNIADPMLAFDTTALRSAGVAVWDLVITKPLRHHLRDLANPNIPCSLIVGAQELTATDYTVRDIDGTLCATTQDQLTQSLLNRRNQNAH